MLRFNCYIEIGVLFNLVGTDIFITPMQEELKIILNLECVFETECFK